MTDVLPGGGMDILRDELMRVSSSGSRSLGFAFPASLAVSFWSAKLFVRSKLRKLQQNLRDLGCGDRFHGLDLDLSPHRSAWGGTRRSGRAIGKAFDN
jgi:hypothetical protein